VRAANGAARHFTIEREGAAEAVVKLAGRADTEPEVALGCFGAEPTST
jgi:hypothetical protein